MRQATTVRHWILCGALMYACVLANACSNGDDAAAGGAVRGGPQDAAAEKPSELPDVSEDATRDSGAPDTSFEATGSNDGATSDEDAARVGTDALVDGAGLVDA